MQEHTIFVVDDVDTNLVMAAKALEEWYRVVTLPSAAKMFSVLERLIPSLILLDVKMPGVSGFEAIKRLKANRFYADIPVVFLTSLNDSLSEARGLELGAVDFITKPFSQPVLINRLKNHLNLDGMIRERTRQLERYTQQLVSLHNNIIFTLADLVESRDENTGGHINRTSAYLKILTQAMLANGLYSSELLTWDIEVFVSSARLHDLGKILVSDAILNKPGSLSAAELKTMKLHTTEGERIIKQMISRTGMSDFLTFAQLTAAYHHERWDGSGYPYGLHGTEIPLQGRIMAIVDAFDALTSVRPYKRAFSSEEAYRIIMEEAGRQFDPWIVEVFCGARKQIEKAMSEHFSAGAIHPIVQ